MTRCRSIGYIRLKTLYDIILTNYQVKVWTQTKVMTENVMYPVLSRVTVCIAAIHTLILHWHLVPMHCTHALHPCIAPMHCICTHILHPCITPIYQPHAYAMYPVRRCGRTTSSGAWWTPTEPCRDSRTLPCSCRMTAQPGLRWATACALGLCSFIRKKICYIYNIHKIAHMTVKKIPI